MGRRDLDSFAGLKGTREEYSVYDVHYEKIGKVDDLLVDGGDRVRYIGVKMGLFGTNSTIVPVEIVRINDKRLLIEVSEPAESIKRAPHIGHGDELTPELENHVRSYFGLETLRPTPEHDPQGPYIPEEDPRLAADDRIDTVPGERAGTQDKRASEPTRADTDTGSGSRREPATTGGNVTIHRLRR